MTLRKIAFNGKKEGKGATRGEREFREKGGKKGADGAPETSSGTPHPGSSMKGSAPDWRRWAS
jgi:hypothetical protein